MCSRCDGGFAVGMMASTRSQLEIRIQTRRVQSHTQSSSPPLSVCLHPFLLDLVSYLSCCCVVIRLFLSFSFFSLSALPLPLSPLSRLDRRFTFLLFGPKGTAPNTTRHRARRTTRNNKQQGMKHNTLKDRRQESTKGAVRDTTGSAIVPSCNSTKINESRSKAQEVKIKHYIYTI